MEEEETKVLSMNDTNGNEVKLYPNPTKGFVNIEWERYAHAELSGLSGRVLIKTSTRQFDLRDLSEGVYFIKLIAKDKEEVVFRIIKE